MTTAKVIVAFKGLPDGAAQVRQYSVGDLVEGDLAAVAIREKWATDGTADLVLNDLTVPELKQMAEDRKIDLGDATKKADIIAAIELATEGQS